MAVREQPPSALLGDAKGLNLGPSVCKADALRHNPSLKWEFSHPLSVHSLYFKWRQLFSTRDIQSKSMPLHQSMLLLLNITSLCRPTNSDSAHHPNNCLTNHLFSTLGTQHKCFRPLMLGCITLHGQYVGTSKRLGYFSWKGCLNKAGKITSPFEVFLIFCNLPLNPS